MPFETLEESEAAVVGKQQSFRNPNHRRCPWAAQALILHGCITFGAIPHWVFIP
jgi:hypothetical protein